MGEFLELAEEKGIEAFDFVIDRMTESKYFNGFPIISQMLGILKAVKLIPNYIYATKTCAFLDGIKADNMDCDTFSQAMKKLNKNPRKFEEELLFLIEKAENTDKANLLGYFTRMFALRIISYDDFVFYSNTINNTQMGFLKVLSKIYDNKDSIEKSPLYGILLAQGFSENGNGLIVEGTTLNIGVRFSKKLEDFGSLLNNYFQEKCS